VISFMIYDGIVRSASRPRQPRTVPIPVSAVDRRSDDGRRHTARGIVRSVEVESLLGHTLDTDSSA